MSQSTNFLVIGLDGLRPELIEPDLMPNLSAFVRDGVPFSNHRSVFPSETYPNIASLMTGCPPGMHGIVANEFLVPHHDPRRTWIGSSLAEVERWNLSHGGRFHSVTTIGDALGAAGKTLWTISSGSAGSARLMHPTVERYPGHRCLLIKSFAQSSPSSVASDLEARIGPPPPREPPETSLVDQTYAADAFLALEKDHGMPDVAVVWFGGPDHALHVFGLGAEETRRMIRHVDKEVGRLLDWWRSHPERERIQIVVASDHGHVTQTRKIDFKSFLSAEGFKVGPHLEEGAEIAHISCYGWSGNIRVRNHDRGLLDAVAQALMSHPATGMVFTRGQNEVEGIVAGTFAQSLVRIAHPDRSADLDYCLRGYDDIDPFGYAGTCWSDNSQVINASNHGGLHRNSMRSVLVFGGSAFKGGTSITTPSAIIDIAPTILHFLGVSSETMGGRVLTESWIDGEVSPAETRRLTAEWNGFTQELITEWFGGFQYLREGGRVT